MILISLCLMKKETLSLRSTAILDNSLLKTVREILVEQDETEITTEATMVEITIEEIMEDRIIDDEVADEDNEAILPPTINEQVDLVSEDEMELDETLETEEITTIRACRCLSTSLSPVTHNFILFCEDLNKHPLLSICKASLWLDNSLLFCWMGPIRYYHWTKDTSATLLEDDV